MEAFEKLPEEKRKRILNAAYFCFGQNGYRKTSVADIAGAAGVSKASIFHYFGSKQALWLYLYQFGSTCTGDTIFRAVANAGDDLFQRLWMAQEAKLRVGAEYPGMFIFFTRSVQEDAPELQAGRSIQYQDYIRRGFDALLNGIDLSRFKPGVDISTVVNLITWVGEGYAASLPNAGKSHDAIWDDGWHYVEILKPIFYKEEYL